MSGLIKRASAAVFIALLLLFPAVCLAEEAEDGELTEELIRQIGLLDTGEWESFFKESGIPSLSGFASVDELLLALAEGSTGDPGGMLDILKAIALRELKSFAGILAALAVAAAVTLLPALIRDEELKPVLALALGSVAASLCAGAFSALCGRTFATVGRAAKLTQGTMPVMCGMLTLMGSASTAGVMRPLMLFLSGTVLVMIESLALPLSAAGGVLAVANSFSEEGKLSGFVKFSSSAVKTLLGVVSALYIAVIAVQGMTMGLKDGVSIRTARYAIGRMIPIVGSMVSGTVESIMGCALLVKNGVGTVAALLLVSVMAAPVFALLSALLLFRAAAAFAGTFAEARIARLYSDMAEAVKNLLACAAAASSMLAVTIAVFLISGGMTAGLW